MSSDGTLEPQYGVKTCGKTAEEPFAGLGPCRLEPDHGGLCKYAVPGVPGGLMSFREMPMPQLGDHPWYSDEEVLRYRRISKRLFRGSMAAFAVNILVVAWTLLRAFGILP